MLFRSHSLREAAEWLSQRTKGVTNAGKPSPSRNSIGGLKKDGYTSLPGARSVTGRSPMPFTSGPNFKKVRVRDEAYLAAIRECPCIECGNRAVPAHLRYADSPGIGQTVGDDFVVPLCTRCHTSASSAQHRSGVEEWWKSRGIDPIPYAKALRKAFPDIGLMRLICFLGPQRSKDSPN